MGRFRRARGLGAADGRLLLAIPLLAAGALALWLFAGGARDPGPGAGKDPESGAAGEEAPAEAGGGGAGLKGSDPLHPKDPGMKGGEDEAAKPPCTKAEGVYGRVTDSREKPIPGAKVTLFGVDPANPWSQKDGPVVATADVAADGSYLVGPAPAGRLKVRAEASGWANETRLVPARGARVDLILDRSGSLKVTAKDRKGAAVAGADVRVSASFQTGGASSSTRQTAESGEAVVDGLPGGPVEVRVSARGYGAVNLSQVMVQPAKTSERTVVLGPALPITGRVVDGERESPVEGAEVTAKVGWDAEAPKSDVAKTDADGRFRIEAAGGANEWIQVAAKKEGFAEGQAGVQVQAGAQVAQEVLIRLGKGGNATGNVLDAEGRAVAGARVIYLNMGYGTPTAALFATTDADGQFALPLPPGALKDWSYQVGAFAPGKGVGAAQVQASQVRGATIRLVGVGTVTGKGVSAAGAPLEGAAVTLMPDWGGRGVPLPPDAAQNWMVRNMLWDPRVANLAATTDAEGAFRIDEIPVGAYRADATWGLDRGAASDVVSVRAGGTETVRVEVTSGSVIEGKVLDAQGVAIYGAFVNAYDPQNRGGGSRQMIRSTYARSDAEGRFVLRSVVGGPWTISASASGFGQKSVAGIAVGDRSVELRLASLGWIDGVVTADGSPFQGAFTVSIQSTSPQGPQGNEDFGWRAGPGGWGYGGGREETFTSADGAFTFRGVAAGSWKVNVTTQDDWIPASNPEVAVNDGRGAGPVEIRLTRGASVCGAVLEEGTRAPISGATVNLRIRGTAASAGTTWAWIPTDAKGQFSAQGLASGTYIVSVQSPSGLTIEDEVRLEAGQRTQKDLFVAKWGTVRIRVVDPDGGPVAGANVSLQTERGTWIQPNWDLLRKENLLDFTQPNAWNLVMTTDATGTNVRYHVPPGRVQVQVGLREGGKRPPPPAWVVVESDRTSELTVALPPATETPGGGDGK